MASVFPGRTDFDGVFLLGRDELKELDGLIDDAKKVIDAHVKQKIKYEAKAVADRRGIDVNDSESFEQLQRKVTKDHWELRKEPSRTAVIRCKSGKPFGDSKFDKVMNIAALHSERPVSASGSYAHGGADIEIEVDASSNKIKISTRGGEELERDVVGPFIDWVLRHQRIEPWRWFSSNVLGIAIFASGMMLLWLSLLQVRTITERPSIEAKAAKIVEGGIEEDEIPEAIEHLLRLDAGLYETQEVLTPQSWYVGLIVIWIFALLAWLLTPQTVIGVGTNTHTLLRHKWSIKAGAWILLTIAGLILVRVLLVLVSSFA